MVGETHLARKCPVGSVWAIRVGINEIMVACGMAPRYHAIGHSIHGWKDQLGFAAEWIDGVRFEAFFIGFD